VKKPHQPIELIGVQRNRQEWQQIFVCLPYDKPINLPLLVVVVVVGKHPESIDIHIYITHWKFFAKINLYYI
jgi:hypothetical protein